jgi:hypothetical protein
MVASVPGDREKSPFPVESVSPSFSARDRTQSAYLADFISSLPCSERPVFLAGHRLSRDARDELVRSSCDSYIQRIQPVFSDYGCLSSDRDFSIPARLQSSYRPSPLSASLFEILADSWHFPEPLVLEVIVDGIMNGFAIGFPDSMSRKDLPRDSNSSSLDPAVARRLLAEYQMDGRVSSWSRVLPFDEFATIPMAMVPKGSDWRLVLDFSKFVNGGVPSIKTVWRSFCRMRDMFSSASGCLQFCWDVVSAFPLFRIRPCDWHLQVLSLPSEDGGGDWFAVCFAFMLGSRWAGHRWEQFSAILTWQMIRHGLSSFSRWVDDWRHLLSSCRILAGMQADRIRFVLARWSIPFHKVQGPSLTVTSCGLTWCSSNSSYSIAPEKREEYKALFHLSTRYKKWSSAFLEHLIGVSVYVATLCPVAFHFVPPFFRLAKKARPGYRFISPDADSRRSAYWFRRSVSLWAGSVRAFPCPSLYNASAYIFTDYSELQGAGLGFISLELLSFGFLSFSQSQREFATATTSLSSTRGELMAVLAVLFSFGHRLCGTTVVFFVDCEPAAGGVVSFRSRTPENDVLLQTISTVAFSHNINVIIQAISRSFNGLADALARRDLPQFWRMIRPAPEFGLFRGRSPSPLHFPPPSNWPFGVRPF